jgi:hypothetical protein
MVTRTNPYDFLFVDRGPPGGNMTTEALHLAVRADEVYRVTSDGLAVGMPALYTINLEEEASRSVEALPPPHLEVAALWDRTPYEPAGESNILGGNGLLTIPFERIEVPCVAAARESLAYYGAILLKERDLIRFPDREYPIFKMTVGPRYIDEFLMAERGDGFYLEFHHDKPHFHMPLRGGGYYILARWNEEGTRLRITGFKIADGDAVYTKKGAIHCDAALTGDLLVGYDKAEDYSTVLLRTEGRQKTSVMFYEPAL